MGSMSSITVTYAQEKAGQKLHLVPVISGDTVANTALCGKRVSRWRMTINVSLGHSCQNCRRVNRQNGRRRALAIVLAVLQQEG